jgi:hypothetical protein
LVSGVVSLVGDILGKIVAFAEDFADKADGVLGVRVVFTEDECLGDEDVLMKSSGRLSLKAARSGASWAQVRRPCVVWWARVASGDVE